MYYYLQDQYALRGYKGIPYFLVNSDNSSQSIFIRNKKIFELLELCDGTIDFDLGIKYLFPESYLKELLNHKIVLPSELPRPISNNQRYRLSSGRYIQAIHWSITGDCNLRCKHCYISAPHKKYHDMTTEQCLAVIEQMVEANVQSVSLTGGEVFTRTDLFLLIDTMLAKGIKISSILTNGLLATENILEKIKERGINCSFSLSFDCIGCHDWLRGVEGVEEKTITAMKRIKQHGFFLAVDTALHRGNIDQILPTYDLLQSVGIDNWKLSLIHESGEWKEQSDQKKVSTKELHEYYNALILKHKQTGSPFGLQLDGYFMKRKNREYHSPFVQYDGTEACLDKLSCTTCNIMPYLLPDGTLIPCPAMTDLPMTGSMPNLLEPRLVDALNDQKSAFSQFVNLRVKDVLAKNEQCGACQYKLQCGSGCRAMAMQAGYDMYGVNPPACAFFKSDSAATISRLMAD